MFHFKKGGIYRPLITDYRLLITGLLLAATAYAATTVEVTTNILIKNVPPVGTHMDNNYWESSLLKRRVAKNFEGTQFRRIHSAIFRTNGFFVKYYDYNALNAPDYMPIYTNSYCYTVSDPLKGITRKIVKLENKTIDYNGEVRTWGFLTFDQPITIPPGYDDDDEVGVLVYSDHYLSGGNIGLTGTYKYSKDNNIIVTNDCAPGSFGNSSCRMDGTLETCAQHHQGMADGGTALNTTWRIGFWIKKDSGNPVVTVGFAYQSPDPEVAVPDDWEYREMTQTFTRVNSLNLEIQVNGGAILIDDITLDQIEGDSNVVWRTEAMDIFKELNPGILRSYRCGGMSIENCLRPLLESYGYKCTAWSPFGVYKWQSKETLPLQDACFVVEELDCALHYNISGTIFPWEVTNLIEFLAGPTNTYWGNERAKQGHPEPWTDSLKLIHIQIGNEQWNTAPDYKYKGFRGPDYWHDIIQFAKSSPYYTNNIQFTPDTLTWKTDWIEEILADCTNADKMAVGGYTVRKIFNSEIPRHHAFDRPGHDYEHMFKWYLGSMIYETYAEQYMGGNKPPGPMKDIEFTWYEYNNATHSGDGHEYFKLFTPAFGTGLGLANYSLLNLKEYGIRYQCFYSMTGDIANQPGYNGTPLFGMVHNLKAGECHKRPVYYANMIANKVREGNLMETIHSESDPQFTAFGRFEGFGNEFVDWTSNSYNTIYSYAFQSGTGTNGIILFNYDLDATQHVEILLKEYVKDEAAEMWLLTSDSFSNNNEEVQGIVTSEYYSVSGFKSGYNLSMPPLSEIVLKWATDGDFPDLKTSVTNIYINEGSTANFNVMLTSEPKIAVTVSVARVSGDTDITVQSGSPAVLDSSNWAAGETITLFAAEDDDMELGEAVFQCTAEGMTTIEVTAHELENDNGILVNPSALSVPEGGNADFYVRLSTDPGGALAVSVARVSGDENISAAPATLNFNAGNWETEQPVTVSAAEDPDIENGTAVIACTATGYLSNTVTATEADNDTVALLVSETVIKIPEGGTNVFSVKLTAIPPDNSTITVYRVSGDADLFVTNGQNLVFDSTNWDVDHFVTIFAKEDADKKIGTAVFRCEPLFPNTDGSVDVFAYETENDTINISLQKGVLPNDSYTNGIDDTWLKEGEPYLNSGDNTRIRIAGDSDSALFRWDLSSVPTTASVTWATITLNTYELLTGVDVPVEIYESKRNWTELGATYNSYDGVNPWQTAGGTGVGDKGSSVFCSGVLPFEDAVVMFSLNDAGLAAINNWIRNTEINNGFIFVPATNNSSCKTSIRTSEADKHTGETNSRPILALGYTFDANAPTNESIIINNGDEQTTNFVVELNLFAENPTPIDMQISELSDFSDVSWIPYQTNYTWTFGAPFDEKTVYARFSDGGAGISDTASDTIDLIPEISVIGNLLSVIGMGLIWLRKYR